MLGMPFEFMEPFVNQSPTEARPLRLPVPSKRKKYLELAELLIKRFPSDTMGRGAEFLVNLVQNTHPGELPPLDFYTTARAPDLVQTGLPSSVARVAPAMRFEAVFSNR